VASGERLDRPKSVPPVVDAEAYLTLVAAANALGELVARASAEARYPAEQEANAVYEQVRQAVVEIRAAIAAGVHARRR
jgi:Na+-transporting methylmalonyl-CoA/oxaloacetate decarboxylase gamma subunit